MTVPEASPWVEAIGWTLLHSLWQGAVVAGILALAMVALRRASASARYGVACAAMLAIAAMPAATLVRLAPSGRTIGSGPGAFARSGSLATGASPAIAPPGVDRTETTRRVERFLPATVGAWMLGVAVFSIRLLGGWLRSRRWRSDRAGPMDHPWPTRFDRLKDRMGIRRAVRLLESAAVEVPMVVGWIRPAVLVPISAACGLPAPELEAILAHELAHIRRHDYLVNLFQCAVEVLMFHHPAAWWISGLVRRERESCSDDLALAAVGDRLVYARALAAMEGLRVPEFSPSPAASGGVLLARIRRVLDPQEESMHPVRILAGLAVVGILAPLWFAHASEGPPAGPAGHAPAPIEHPHPPANPARQHIPIVDSDSVVGLDPPGEAEVWAQLEQEEKDRGVFDGIRQHWVSTGVERIGSKVDPVTDFPLAGRCQLVHCHYKCTLTYDEPIEPAPPPAVRRVERKTRVVYIDKDFLRRVPTEESGWARVEEAAGTPRDQARLPDGTIGEVRLEENGASISADSIRPWLLSRVGQPFDRQKIHADVLSLMETGRFSQVEVSFDVLPPDSKKYVLIFSVKEMPRYAGVEFRGLGAIGRKEVEDLTGLKVGAPADYMRARNAIHQLDRLYAAHGFHAAHVELIEGGRPGDARVVIRVTEGPRSSIGKVVIEGNRRIGTEGLRKAMEIRPGRPYSLTTGEADRHRLLARYSEIGCLDAEVTIEARPTGQKEIVDVVFRIHEGDPYVLGKLKIDGLGPKQDVVIRRARIRNTGPAKGAGAK